LGAAASDRGDCLTEADIVPGAGDIGAIDEVVDVPVEQEGRYRAGAAHVVLYAEVEVGSLQRLTVGIAELRLITVQQETGEQLTAGGAPHRIGPGSAKLGPVVELVDGVQAGERMAVLVAGIAC